MTINKNFNKKIRKPLVCADLWSGAGGTSSGLVAAVKSLGYELELTAVNHWEIAVATHSKNHPSARHFCKAVDSVNPLDIYKGQRLQLLVASPECFPSGTLVLTSEGYKPIEEIKIGDSVLTHKNRWRKVTDLMTSRKKTVVVTGQGHPGIETTGEHPFYTRLRKQRHRPVSGNYHKYEEPIWTAANAIKEKMFWASPLKIKSLPIPSVGGRGFTLSLNFLWLVGLWLAEGTVRIRQTNGEITICCGNHEADKIESQLNVFASQTKRAGHSELKWRRRKVRTATLFETGHAGLAEWLVKNFGKLAKGKKIPAWVYGLSDDQKQAILNGYLQGDGHLERKNSNSPKQTCQSVSKQLAFGIKTIATTIGYRASIHHRRPVGDFIEGRKVNISNALEVSWTVNPQRNDSFKDTEHHWTKIKTVTKGRENVEVFNISVEEDESYVVEGIVVHNCVHHSRARGGKPRSEQKRADAWDLKRWIEKLYIENVLIENVMEFVDWGPLGKNGKPLKSKKGVYFNQFIDFLKVLYKVEWRILNCADYGDATTRERFFLMAKRGKNKKIFFPEPTHASRKVLEKARIQPSLFPTRTTRQPWRPAKDIIDWSVKGESIFMTKEDVKEAGLRIRRPLTENTMRRIFAGLFKYSLKPFTIGAGSATGQQPPRDINDPLKTITTKPAFGAGEPFLVNLKNKDRRMRSIDEPCFTQTTANHQYLVKPFLIQYFGERNGQEPRTRDPGESPLWTVTGQGRTALAEPSVINMAHTLSESDEIYCDVKDPLKTICGKGMFAFIEPFLVKFYGGHTAALLSEPMPTITANYEHYALAEPYIVPCNQAKNDTRTQKDKVPTATVPGADIGGAAEPYLIRFKNNQIGSSIHDPLYTLTTRDSYALVIPQIGIAVDILFRMLMPSELAAAMSFPKSYHFVGTREEQIKQIGNAVPCKTAEALCKAILEN